MRLRRASRSLYADIPANLVVPLAPVMGMAVRRANRQDLAALKAVLESMREVLLFAYGRMGLPRG